MIILIVINEAPYGNEKSYNALRLAMALQKEPLNTQVHVFLMADAVYCALADQTTPQGYYNIERMVKSVIVKGGQVKACGTCANARGVANLQLVGGAEISTMAELAQWSVEADKVFTF